MKRNPSNRLFNPWIGSNYRKAGFKALRVLILGEANYGKEGEQVPEFTAAMIRKLGQTERFRFYTVLQKLVENRDGYVTDEERREFWENVAFYNFIQQFPGDSPRHRPTQPMWDQAVAPYLQTLNELKPNLVIAVGFDLSEHLPDNPKGIHLCSIQHPSSRGFQTDHWKEVIAKAFVTAVSHAGH